MRSLLKELSFHFTLHISNEVFSYSPHPPVLLNNNMAATFETLLPSGGGVYVSFTWVWVGLCVLQPVELTGNDARWLLRLVTKGHEAPSLFTGTFVYLLSPEPLCRNFDYLKTAKLEKATCRHTAQQPQLSLSFPHPRPSADIWLKKPCRKWILLSYYFSHTFESPHSLWDHQSWGPRRHWAEISHPSVIC